MDITKREPLGQMLRDSPDVLAGIIASAMDAIIATDDAQRIVLFNAAAERMFACPADEAVGTSIDRFIPQRFRAEHSRHVRRFDESGVTNRNSGSLGTLWGLRSTGEEFPIEAAISKVDAGGTKFFAVVIRDVTERSRVEETMRESERRFRLVADAAPVLIWMSGTDKLCTYFNKPWLDFTGRSIEKEIGNGWAEGVHPEDFQRCLDTYSQSFDRQDKFRMEYRLRRHDGEYRWILDNGVPRYAQEGTFAGYIGSCIDVTDSKRAEELLKIFVKNVPVGVAMFDCEMRFLQVSDRWCADYGVDASQVVGRLHYELVPDLPERWKQAHRRTLEGHTLRGEEDRWDRQGGVATWIRWETRPWKTPSGAVGGIMLFAEDITHRKQMEEALSGVTGMLMEAEEKERARIARELHDDINQRLAMLTFGLDQLKVNPSDFESRVRELREQTIELSMDVEALSHDLHSSKLEYLGVVAGMRSWCTEFGERQGMQIDFKHEVQSSLPSDIGLCLFRVLQEALHNAAKHSGVTRVEVHLYDESGEIHLTVSDLGKGFDSQAVHRGKGLGLISMRERIRLAHGTITIESKPMSGTTVHVRVPLGSENASRRATG